VVLKLKWVLKVARAARRVPSLRVADSILYLLEIERIGWDIFQIGVSLEIVWFISRFLNASVWLTGRFQALEGVQVQVRVTVYFNWWVA
jgi:hypothetical protein